jgi:hypothetical protein
VHASGRQGPCPACRSQRLAWGRLEAFECELEIVSVSVSNTAPGSPPPAPRITSSYTRRTTSTLSCDIARQYLARSRGYLGGTRARDPATPNRLDPRRAGGLRSTFERLSCAAESCALLSVRPRWGREVVRASGVGEAASCWAKNHFLRIRNPLRCAVREARGLAGDASTPSRPGRKRPESRTLRQPSAGIELRNVSPAHQERGECKRLNFLSLLT